MLKTVVTIGGGGGGGNGTVTSVTAGTGLDGGTITTSGTISLANTAVSAGTYGSNGAVSQVTIDAQGRITSASNVGITLPVANISGAVANTVNILAGTGISGGGALTGNVTINNAGVLDFNGRTGLVNLSSLDVTTALGYTPGTSNATGTVTNVATGIGLTGGPITTTGTIDLANTAVSPGVYGNATQVGQVTVDAQGRITSAANVTIAISTANVSGLGTMATQDANNVNITGGSINTTAVNTVATTGNTVTFAVSSLPLIPEGYITINLNGVAKKIPYYGV